MIRKAVSKPTAIPATGTTTPVIHLRDHTSFGVITPATLTSTELSFKVCNTPDGTFVPLYDSAGNQIAFTVTTSRAYGLATGDADALACWEFAQIVGDQTEAAARELIVAMK